MIPPPFGSARETLAKAHSPEPEMPVAPENPILAGSRPLIETRPRPAVRAQNSPLAQLSSGRGVTTVPGMRAVLFALVLAVVCTMDIEFAESGNG